MSYIISSTATSANRAAFMRNNNVADITQSEIDNNKAAIQKLVDRIKGEISNSGTTYPMDNNPYKTYDNQFDDSYGKTWIAICDSDLPARIDNGDFKLKCVNPYSDENHGSDVFWESVARDLKGLLGGTQLGGSDSIGSAVENLAAKYAAVRQRLESRFSGEELQTQLQRLDETFNKAADDMGKEASKGLFGSYVGNKVKSAFRSQADAYYNFAKSNPGYEREGLAGKDERLKKNDSIMASLLKKAYAASGASSTSGVRELKAASDIANVLSRDGGYIFRGANEGEDFGLLAGVESMKIDAILEKYGASDSLRKVAYSQLAKQTEMAMKEIENHRNIFASIENRYVINRKEAQQVMDFIRKEWLASRGNIRAALQKAGDFIGSPYRTKDQSTFSKNFFSIDKSTYAHMPDAAAYATPHYDEILADWQQFASTVL